MCRILYRFLASLARLTVRSGRSKDLEIIVLRLWVPETRPWSLICRDGGPMLSPRVPNLVPIPGPRMERETPGQRPRPNYGHPHPSGARTASGASLRRSPRGGLAADGGCWCPAVRRYPASVAPWLAGSVDATRPASAELQVVAVWQVVRATWGCRAWCMLLCGEAAEQR